MTCPDCGGTLDFRYEKPPTVGEHSFNSMWRYHNLLPVRPGADVLTMGEGWTPLVCAWSFDSANVYIKNETRNPTGSHKDRALAIGITKALEFGRTAVMLYSDGSTALSSAAYAARAGLRNITLVPAGTPKHRVLPLFIYNSTILEFQGSADEGLSWAHQTCLKLDIYETSTYRLANPYESEGAKTIGFEIFEQLNGVPDWIVVPIGGGGTLAGIWRAFCQLREWGFTTKRPHMIGILPQGYKTIENLMNATSASIAELKPQNVAELPETIQVKIAMPSPPDALEAVAALRESGGMILYASDDDVLRAQKTLGSREGIYAEPSAAAALVGVERLLATQRVASGELVVALITGSGFRETNAISDRVSVTITPIDSSSGLEVVRTLLKTDAQENGQGG